MSRYFTRPSANRPFFVETPLWGDDEPSLPNLAVSDHRPVETGLLDHRGDPIWRSPNPVGFHRPKERP